MKIILYVLSAAVAVYLLAYLANWLSYTLIKCRVVRRQKWDLNIACGHTDGGGINADIVQHADVPNFVLVKDIYNLPFADKQFKDVLCSHTIEHVDDVQRLHEELNRVGERVIYLLPPLWDFSAALNLIEHKTIFLSMRSEHQTLPPYFGLPFADTFQRWFGQKIKA
ncbi:MAG: methyltransferase domain-containing protein [Caldithrix sp.]|nr:methyltransferase domain-containing protein [Caldithrix sp.]